MSLRSFIFILLCFAGHLRCGFSNNEEQRIINGINTDITEVPFMISLRQHQRRGQHHICGASIINRYWVVTAAHCIKEVRNPLRDITLCSGSSIYNKNCTIHNIVKYTIHENYSDETFDYDIAVIKVSPSFTYNDHTKAISLASNGYVRKKWGKVCGWGFYRKVFNHIDETTSKELKCAEVPRVDTLECERDYRHFADIGIKLTPRMICYGYQKGGTDACEGDSGGPIVDVDKVLVGISSWGIGCAEKNSPGVYIDCVLLEPWIRNNTRMGDA